MEDGLVKAIDLGGTLRAAVACTTQLVEEARQRHSLSYTATAALGRALTGAALVTSMVSRSGRVTMKFNGNGPLGKIVVDARGSGSVVGYVENPNVELPLNSLGNFDISRAVGRQGYLHVTVDSGFGAPHTSSVELRSGEIGEDINHYLVASEQTGSVMIVGVHVTRSGVVAAGGLMAQLLPDHTEETICGLENGLATLGSLTFLLRQGLSLPEILNRALQGFELQKLMSMQKLQFKCNCSYERFVQALGVLNKQDLINMAEDPGLAEGRCHFCNAMYHVERENLLDLAQNYGGGQIG